MLESTTLFIKHLPAELNAADREELLKLVGAVKVRVMPDDGKMKYCAFATFASNEDAKYAMSLLHQREILNRRLVVEFSKKQHENVIPHLSDYSRFKNQTSKENVTKSSDKEVLRLDMEEFSRHLHGVVPALGLDYLPSPLLKYKYPPPTPTIIQNISHALASVPKFYTQVLHLMNKMNLPAPFGPLTPAPPLAPDIPSQENNSVMPGGDSYEVENMDVSSEEESEYESEPDGEKPKVLEKVIPQKRIGKKPKQKKKKQKLSDFIAPPSSNSLRQRTEPSEVFESQPLSQKKISMKNIEKITPIETTTSFETAGGFGAIEPSKMSNDNLDNKLESGEDCWSNSKFITSEELKSKRISSKEMKTMSIFRNFSSGEPTFRLYIKNLAKQVEEKDLRYVFGRFIDQNSEQDRNMFDIRLMKEGRMKGQAFVTLANEKQAMEAIKETNGFVLHTKPLVVQFARSAKPKEEEKKDKKS
ncbi:RNA-binding region-containing protein 3 [Trichonephila clavata]|uniref:RNA-binding region-containing protein 3 n=1 Tax=Trichonephila clavata TaxID=2740835 RepID=A0A8X6GXW3_TRICU|nr:RNA-binding region-containing protein 3 [Trichonephila clavata]